MARRARAILPGIPVHATQRGHHHQRVFCSEQDYRIYLALLVSHSVCEGLEILGWCLMPNHVHLIAIPRYSDSLARALGRTHAEYARLLPAPLKHAGHLWQSRFHSCCLGPTHLWRALLSIERNPPRAGLVPLPEQWPWSSAAVHCGLSVVPPWLSLTHWREQFDPALWRGELASPPDSAEEESLRRATRTGRPWGDEQFVIECEQLLGRPLRPLPPGRPRTRHSASATPPQSAGSTSATDCEKCH